MPRVKDGTKVEIEETITNESRVITVTITAPTKEFLLADILRQRGAITPLETSLRQAVRDSIQGYFEKAEGLISGLTEGQRKPPQTRKRRASLNDKSSLETAELPRDGALSTS
jgi:hypothetical protein